MICFNKYGAPKRYIIQEKEANLAKIALEKQKLQLQLYQVLNNHCYHLKY